MALEPCRGSVHSDVAHADPADAGAAPEGIVNGYSFDDFHPVALQVGVQNLILGACSLADIQLACGDGAHGCRNGDTLRLCCFHDGLGRFCYFGLAGEHNVLQVDPTVLDLGAVGQFRPVDAAPDDVVRSALFQNFDFKIQGKLT